MINKPTYSKDLRALASKNPGKTLATVAVDGMTYQGWITNEERKFLIVYVTEMITGKKVK